MLALASAALIAYLLIPGTLYRTFFSFFIPPKNFQRTRADEVRFAVLAATLPFLLAMLVTRNVAWAAHHPFSFSESPDQSKMDYRTVVGGSYNERYFPENSSRFWEAFNRVVRRQARFVTWFYIFVISEAILLGSLSRNLWRL